MALQKVGGVFLSNAPHVQSLYHAYAANHPSSANVLAQYRLVSDSCVREVILTLAVNITWCASNASLGGIQCISKEALRSTRM